MDGAESYPKDHNNSQTRRTATKKISSFSSTTTSVHVTALDGLVSVNSLFTVAVFIGLCFAIPGHHSLGNSLACEAGVEVAKMIVVFEVCSFSFFLFSSLVAQGLKLALNVLNSKEADEAIRAHINLKVLSFGMLASAFGSVMGCLFLLLSMVNIVEILLGKLSCGSKSAYSSVVMIILATFGIVFYMSVAVYSFTH